MAPRLVPWAAWTEPDGKDQRLVPRGRRQPRRYLLAQQQCAARRPERSRVTEDSSEGIDWSSSNTSTPANMEGVHVPLLIMSMTLHYRMVPAEIFLQHAASQDKRLVFIAG